MWAKYVLHVFLAKCLLQEDVVPNAPLDLVILIALMHQMFVPPVLMVLAQAWVVNVSVAGRVKSRVAEDSANLALLDLSPILIKACVLSVPKANSLRMVNSAFHVFKGQFRQELVQFGAQLAPLDLPPIAGVQHVLLVKQVFLR